MATEPSPDEPLWKRRYRAPAVIDAQVASAAPGRGLAVSNHTGVYQIYGWHLDTGMLHQLTAEPTGKLGGELAPNGQFVYYLQDERGNNIGHFVRVPFTGGAVEDITPDLPLYTAWEMAISEAGNRLGFTAAMDEGFLTYCLDAEPDGTLSAPRLVRKSRSLSYGPLLSYDGEVAVVASTERSGKMHYSAVALDARSGAHLNELYDDAETSVEPGPFAPLAGDYRLLASTNRSGVNRPLIWDARTGERVDLGLEDVDGEVTPWAWSRDGRRVLLVQFKQAVQQLYLYDCESQTTIRLNHPPGSLRRAFFTPANELFVLWSDPQSPPRLIALDPETGVQTRTVLAQGEPLPGRPWRSVSFPSSDGQLIQAWLAVPDGAGPFPLILDTHGGPTAVQTARYAPGSQAWLDHGFAFLTVNYRGSTTFGKRFEEQIWGQLGHWEVEDMVAARAWAVESGVARADQVFLTGWSYGGYLTLQALGTYPELWAGGMGGVVVADWITQYEDENESLRGYDVALFGGTPEEKREAYVKSSPITYAERVRAPVLIIQGRNDSTDPPRQVELYEARLRALGKPIEVIWFDAGHAGSFAQVELGIEHQERMLEFVHRVLGRS